MSCIFLRSCHCCAMGRTTGPLPHRKPNKKEPEGSFLFGTPAGNTSRKIAYSVCRAYFCARAIAAQWGEPRARFRTESQIPHRKPNKKEPEGSFLFGTPAGNRTRNGPLGGGCYIHLTTEAYLVIPREYVVAALLVPPQAVGRTRNGPLGGGCYIHLTTEAYLVVPPGIRRRCAPRATAGGGANPERPLRRGLLYPFNYGSISCHPAGIRRRAWNALYFTTFRAKRQLFSRGKFESTPMLPRSRFLSKNIIQTLDNEAGICIIKLDMIQMVCSESAAAGREGI